MSIIFSRQVLLQQESKQRTLENLRRDVGSVVTVWQRSKVDMAVDQRLAGRSS